MYGPVFLPGSPYIGLDLRLNTAGQGLLFSPLSAEPMKPVKSKSFDVEVLTATLNPQVKDFDTIIMCTMQVSGGGRTFRCSKTFGDLRSFINKIKCKVADIPRFPDISSLTRWGALRAGASSVAGAFNTEYARDCLQEYFRRLFTECHLVNWLPEVYSFFWVPVSPPGTLEPILEEPSETETETEAEAEAEVSSQPELQ